MTNISKLLYSSQYKTKRKIYVCIWFSSDLFSVLNQVLWNHLCLWGDQCSWLLLLTLAPKFTSPWLYIQAFVWSSLRLSWLHYQQNDITKNQENLGSPRILPPWIKNDSTVCYMSTVFKSKMVKILMNNNLQLLLFLRSLRWFSYLRSTIFTEP